MMPFMIPIMLQTTEPAPATPAYCVEGHPDYDRDLCEAEDPLHRWKRLKEESIERQLNWIESGCICPSEAKNETEQEKLYRLECEKACVFKKICDPKQSSYNKARCARQLFMNGTPIEYEEDDNETSCDSCGEEPPEGIEEDPLDKWRRQQCERVCEGKN